MRFELVRNLKGNEILAKSLFDGYGRVLLPSGTKLNISYINRIRQSGFYYIYIEDKDLEDIKYDRNIENLKQTTLKRLPNMFHSIIDGNRTKIEESLRVIEELTSYIIEEGDINTNLYEVIKYDNYTYVHSIDTGIMSIFLAKMLNLKISSIKEIGISSILHDIGKIVVPSEIINKKGRFTKEEFEEVKKHPVYGYRILKNAGIKNNNILAGVIEHHERVDGTGYPFGVKGGNINQHAKIISLCDVFTAISADRCYRSRFKPNEAYEYILCNVNTMFDRDIVTKFKENFYIYPLGVCVRLSNGVEGYVVRQNKSLPDRPVVRVNYNSATGERIPYHDINLLSAINVTIDSIVGEG
ncbi:HD-GYP domain-containing protein [Clostridium sp. A1-XYC3]|uniref:HD-GYP domain-containing protein n=1 Tax=Clostridium tanneri TaxID=3037988 RepID=A0ABU4JUS2_9CLOT|nr:HD-GYP domain-containing protein [Clostridium sp. A1-XYC3]MDW8801902.1 HD-GYP domain-containing protein [Clostridium sp. A1-XYC3]